MQVHHAVFDHVIKKCRDLDPIAVAIVSLLSEVALKGALEAARAGLINPYLVGPRARIASLAREHGLEIEPYLIVDVADDFEAAQRGVELCLVGHLPSPDERRPSSRSLPAAHHG
jgi:phosphate acetyltransferase